MPDVAIINSGGANIASLVCALDRLGGHCTVTTDAATIRSASHVVLPGVGAAADAMKRLREQGLSALICQLSQPVLGICLGMQLLAERSDEENAECLGILPGVARKLDGSPLLPVPNMGWCPVIPLTSHPLLDGIASGSYFYFLHSYALPVSEFTLATARHASPLAAVAARGNFFATQFHPERSSASGARLLANFLALRP
ncbi:MAG: imidazole glycerol phosphate synthase subunit HisH [Woeseia sp.]